MQFKWAITAYLPLNVNTVLSASVLLYIWEHIALAMLDCHRTLKHWLYGLPSCMRFCEHAKWLLKFNRTCDSGDWCLFCLQRHGTQVAMGRLFYVVLQVTFLLHTGGRRVPLTTHQQRRRALKLQASATGTPFQPISGCGGERTVKRNAGVHIGNVRGLDAFCSRPWSCVTLCVCQ